jgi:phosphoglycerate kinase
MLTKKIGLEHITKHLKWEKVLMRVDFNVPVKEGKIKDTTRIVGALPSIKKILKEGAKSLVLMSQMGRPNGKKSAKHSLAPVAPVLEKLLGTKVTFIDDCVGKKVEDAVKNASNGQIFLLENLRFYGEEEGKIKNDKGEKVKVDKDKIKAFRKSLTSLGNLYVNDAFGTAHRAHSSMVGINH